MLNKNTGSVGIQFHSSASHHAGQGHNFWLMALGSMGVVYGDIGTSPLYAFREAVVRAVGNGGVPGAETVYGILSLMLWTLIIIVTLKYVLLLLYADNRGEGGILTLTALAQKSLGVNAGVIILLGMAGAALFYGDAAITPAISVLSAVEGLELVTPSFSRFVLPLSFGILIGLFLMQKKGTKSVSILFGPVVTVWMLVMAGAGLPQIMRDPHIILAVNPFYAVRFVAQHGLGSLGVLGAVFLTVTGAEALYADLGHFGRKPIQAAWLVLVLPCLFVNYLGQGALVLSDPKTLENPFFLMVPHAALLPLVILATLATIIASQAVITGTYSLTSQAIQLGLLPRLQIKHTSTEHEGQIFMPKVNSLLMLAVLFLVLSFGSSGALASAYGIAVTGTMLITSLLAFIVIWKDWRRSPAFSFFLVLPFVLVEGIFLVANLTKVFDGGIVPLLFAAFMVLTMGVWVRGSRYLVVRTRRQTMPLKELIHSFADDPPKTIKGTAIFLTGDSQSAPIALLQNLKHNKILHEQNIILTVVTARIPKVPESQRAVIERLSSAMTSVILYFGYMEIPDVPRALALTPALPIDLREVSYFLGRRTLVPDPRRGLPEWQERLFIPMMKAAANATDFFRLPPGKVVELGVQIAV
jgi:KUP system potassium uptake protein